MPEVDVFTAIANPTRREVLRLLREHGPHPVAELAAPASQLLLTLWKRASVDDPDAARLLAGAITP